MKAVTFNEHGGVEVLKYEDVAEPSVGPTQVLVKVRATGCNYNDVWARRGLPGMKFDMPHISGSDAAGEVVSVGDAVHSVAVGDEVVVHPALSCRICRACTSGREFFCRRFQIWGFQTGPLDGAYAEYALLPESNIVPKPKSLSWEQAAATPLVLLTAWHMLVTRAGLKPGEDVLIWGASGGIGHVAVQIAKATGARVIAAAGTDEKCATAEKLGANECINYKARDVMAEVRRLTDRRGVDVVFEHVGEATWERSIQALAWGGRLVTCGNTTGFNAATDLRFLFNKQLSLLGSHIGTKAELLDALRLVEMGKVKPLVGKTFPLKEAAAAQRSIESGDHIGKLVLIP